jgi:hypothetical protein
MIEALRAFSETAGEPDRLGAAALGWLVPRADGATASAIGCARARDAALLK